MTMLVDTTDLLTTDEAAKHLRVQAQTLAAWRCTGRHGLRFTRVGRKVLYRRADIERFLEKHSGTSCAEIAAACA